MEEKHEKQERASSAGCPHDPRDQLCKGFVVVDQAADSLGAGTEWDCSEVDYRDLAQFGDGGSLLPEALCP